MDIILYTLIGITGIVLTIIGLWILTLRRVVPTSEVHVVQSAKGTLAYGVERGEDGIKVAGNTYYAWPSWLPRLGIQYIALSRSNFQLDLENYAAYDKARLPFVLDLSAFFRIDNPIKAAQRVSSIAELRSQILAILEGAARSVLASKDIDAIMIGRSEFGESFTNEVDDQLKEWGVASVKSIELMDIRDGSGSMVIANIMEKKKSEIERDSRMTVAQNKRMAEEAEITANREVQVSKQQAEQQVGIATATKDLEVGIANEKTQQQITDHKRVTTEKEMEVRRVEMVKQAEITKDVEVVKAQEDRDTDIARAEGEKNKTVLIAQGNLESEKMVAEAIKLRGVAEAEALKLKELAPVEAQITLAKEIGGNEGYQGYLTSIRQIEANEAIGIEQAKALTEADVKVIANAGSPSDGLKGVGELFSSSGGTKIGAALEGLINTETGKALVDKFIK